MTNETNKEIEQTRTAYKAGRDAIVKELGKNASMDEIADVILLMAHTVLTGFGQLDIKSSVHNADEFHSRLKKIIGDTQKDVNNGGYAGRLM